VTSSSPRSADLSDAMREVGRLDARAAHDIVVALKLSMFPETVELGRYRRLRSIGRGGHGIVYQAYDPVLDRSVAIKVLLGATRRSATMRERFRREAQVLAQIHHPNIVEIFDVGVSIDGDVEQTYVVMEYVEGESLASWLARAPGREAILDAFLAAGQGLAAAHAHGIVHRDFKPGNVIVGRDGSARVVDFGVATAIDDGEHASEHAEAFSTNDLTATGDVPGTPFYMAPEQQSGERVDARADQYAWALACWAALAGRDPFGDGEREARLVAKLAGAPARPVVAGIRPAVWAVLERALAPDPQRRFATMDDAIAALELARRGRWMPRIAIVLGGVALFGLGLTSALRDDPCDELRRSVVFPPEVRERWVERAASGRGPIDAIRLAQLDAYAEEFEAVEAEICEGHDLRAIACLRHDGADVAQVLRDVDEIPPDLGPFEELAWTLPPPGDCRDPLEPARADRTRTRIDEFVAMAYVREGRLDQARALALPMLTDQREPTAWSVLGNIAAAEGDGVAAIGWFEAVYFRASALGSHADAASAAAQLVALYTSLQQHDRAAHWERNAVAELERVGGDARSQSILDSHVGEAAFWRGDYETAYRHQRDALTAFTRVYGPTGEATQMARNNLAVTLEQLGRLDEALAHHDELLALRSASSPLSVDVYASSLNLCNVLFRLGAVEEARGHCERSVVAARRALGPESLSARTAEVTLAEVELARERIVSLPPVDELGSSIEAEAVRIQVDMLRAGAARLRGEDAARFVESAWRRALAVLGPDHPMSQTIAFERAAIAARSGDAAALAKLHKLARAGNDVDRARLLAELGIVLLDLDRAKEALPLLVEATERLSAAWVDSAHARRAEEALRLAQSRAE
jgi:tetratricopeptide (TPR) repeat protein/predicted Ser/Thr protein kinase